MRSTLIRSGFVLISLFAFVRAAASAPAPASLEAAQAAFKNALAKVDAEYATKLQAAIEQYGKYLTVAKDSFQKQGNLDVVLAVMEEQKRYAAEKTVPDPAADASPMVVGLRTYYARLVAKAGTSKDEQRIAAMRDHIAQLDALKVSLTKQNKIEDALKVSAEQKEVTKLIAQNTPPPPPEVKMVPCSACDGTGKGDESPCKACDYGGRCSACRGRGSKTVEFSGRTRETTCAACKGTGRCRQCGGSGSVYAPCATCNGTRSVPGTGGETVELASKNGDTQRPPPPTPRKLEGPMTKLSEAEIEKSMREYVETMASLDKMYKQGQPSPIDFDQVASSPAKHVGKLLESEVELLLGHSRSVKVSTGNGTRVLIPYSKSVGERATAVFQTVGGGGRVAITYGVVNEDNITLFDIKSL